MARYYILYKSFIKYNKIVKFIIISFLLCCLNILFIIPQAKAEEMHSLINRIGQKYGVSQEIISRIIKAESDFNPHAISPADARGLMQITRQTWDWICQEYLQVEWNFEECGFEIEKNVEVGVRFLKWISDYLDKNKEKLNDTKENLLLACYNAGPGAVRNYDFRIPPFSETQNYVKKINLMEKNI